MLVLKMKTRKQNKTKRDVKIFAFILVGLAVGFIVGAPFGANLGFSAGRNVGLLEGRATLRTVTFTLFAHDQLDKKSRIWGVWVDVSKSSVSWHGNHWSYSPDASTMAGGNNQSMSWKTNLLTGEHNLTLIITACPNCGMGSYSGSVIMENTGFTTPYIFENVSATNPTIIDFYVK